MRLGIIGVLLFSSGAFVVIVVALSAWMDWQRDGEHIPVEREGADG